jgi:hypothetical protein
MHISSTFDSDLEREDFRPYEGDGDSEKTRTSISTVWMMFLFGFFNVFCVGLTLMLCLQINNVDFSARLDIDILLGLLLFFLLLVPFIPSDNKISKVMLGMSCIGSLFMLSEFTIFVVTTSTDSDTSNYIYYDLSTMLATVGLLSFLSCLLYCCIRCFSIPKTEDYELITNYELVTEQY